MSATLSDIDLKLLPPDDRLRLATLGTWRQTLDSSAQAYASEVQQAVSTSLGAVAGFDETWRLVCQEVLDGKTSEVQTVREHILRSFEDRLRLLREACNLVRFAERVAERDLPEVEQLAKQAEALEIKLEKLSARWQTAEDLEDLAAESIAPTAEKIEAIRRQYGYPQAWYDDDCKPF